MFIIVEKSSLDRFQICLFENNSKLYAPHMKIGHQRKEKLCFNCLIIQNFCTKNYWYQYGR